MGRLSTCARSQRDGCSTGRLGDLDAERDLGALRGCRWAVRLGPEHVEAELVAVYGRPPHLQARLAVAAECLSVTSNGGSDAGRLQLDLHMCDLPADLQAALQGMHGMQRPRAGAASSR